MNKNAINSDELEDTNYKNYNLINSIPNENLVNIANTIDMLSLSDLNGTAMDVLSNNATNIPIKKLFNKNDNKSDNESLIKSLTKEIMNNLQKNNEYNKLESKKNKRTSKIDKIDKLDEMDELDELDEIDEIDKVDEKDNIKKIRITKLSKPLNKKDKKESFDNYYSGLIFDKCFGIKDFVLLFSIYFLLSQDMIKDFFSKYFNSLNS